MFTKKVLLGALLSAALVAVQVTAAFAATSAQTATPATCTVQSITTSTDSTGATVVQVTCADGSTASFNVDDAAALGLVTKNADGSVTVNDTMVGQTIDTTGQSDPCAAPTGTGSGGTSLTGTSSTGATAQHPVGAALAAFFCDKVGTSYDDIMGYHQDGYGFGVIAQALWMADVLGGDSAMVQQILDAKKSGDYSAITLPDGSTPTNWGQFRKAVFGDAMKKNLGMIMSGKAQSETAAATELNGGSSQTLSPQTVHGQGHGGKGKGHGNGHGNSP